MNDRCKSYWIFLAAVTLSGCHLENAPEIAGKCEGATEYMSSDGRVQGSFLDASDPYYTVYRDFGYCPTNYPVCSQANGIQVCRESCRENEAWCNGRCINPRENNKFCGARGECTDDDSTSAHWKGNDCGSNASCVQGSCNTDCGAGTHKSPNGGCEPDTKEDCGSRHEVCTGSQICSGGECISQCENNQVACSVGNKVQCIDPKTSNLFCGADDSCNGGKKCLAEQNCIDGQCVCFSGLVKCTLEDQTEICIDPVNDSDFCGADDSCTNYTKCTGTQICENKNCVLKCSDDEIRCDDKCVNPNENNDYCGATLNSSGVCENIHRCETGQQCVDKQCKCTVESEILCDGTCIDPNTSDTYCGANLSSTNTCVNYKTCASDQVCSGGNCICQNSDAVLCDNNCINPLSNNQYCGAKAGCTEFTKCRDYQYCKDGDCVNDENQCLTFDDPEIEKYAYYKWDTDNNQCITMAEANEVTEIPADAFKNNQALKSLQSLNQFPNLVTIGAQAFSGCTSLTTANLPQIQSIGEHAFENSGLQSVSMHAAATIGNYAFTGCQSLKTIDLSSARTIGESAFKSTALLESATLPEASAIPDSAFEDSGLKSISAARASKVGNNAFANCQLLESVDLPNASTIGESAFINDIQLKAVSLPSASTIETSAFSGCTGVTLVSLPVAVTIEAKAFKDCSSISMISIPNGNTIDWSAFDGCKLLKTMDTPALYKLSSLNCSENDIYFEKFSTGATRMDDAAFKGCSRLKEVTLSKMNTISQTAFQGCNNLQKVSSIARYVNTKAFMGCSSLTSVSLPEATDIKDGAFWGCSSLTSISLPNAHRIQSMGFANTSKLSSISIPEVVEIGDMAFLGSGITSLDIPKVTKIGEYGFDSCASLKTVDAPKLQTIGAYGFRYCGALETFFAPQLYSIGEEAFLNDAELNLCTSSLTSIGTNAFGGIATSNNCNGFTSACSSNDTHSFVVYCLQKHFFTCHCKSGQSCKVSYKNDIYTSGKPECN